MADVGQTERLAGEDLHPHVDADDRSHPTLHDMVRHRIAKRDCDMYGYALDNSYTFKRCIALTAGDSQTS